jgi:hypothetical protein
MKKALYISLALFIQCSLIAGQSASDLIENYSGSALWEELTGTLTFTSTGSIDFEKPDFRNFIWDVPAEVATIVIKNNVTVNGAFHTYHNCTIRGEDRKFSVIFGTNEQSWSKNRRDEGFNNVRAFNYSAIEAKSGTTFINNLTSLNPYGFHVRGGMLHVKNSDFIDDRGGHGNNSDGFVGSDGSTVDSCYFETGDDIIKLYNDITVSNTTIHMVDNSVPIQLGWGDTGNSTGNFINLTITGNSGRFNDKNAIIVGRDGVYTKTININGCDIRNPNASWVSLRVPGQIVQGNVLDAYINIKQFWSTYNQGSYQMTICGTGREGTFYDCSGSSFPVLYEVDGENGSINVLTENRPVGSGEFIKEGNELAFQATPDEGYRVREWNWNNNAVENNQSNEFIIENLNTPTIVKVAFEELSNDILKTEKAQLIIYPNPAREVLNISGLNRESEIRVFDQQGKKLFHQTSGDEVFQYPVIGLNKGMYYISIASGNDIKKGKMIIQ